MSEKQITKPEIGQEYFSLSEDRRIVLSWTWYDTMNDNAALKAGNVYLTKEEAEEDLENPEDQLGDLSKSLNCLNGYETYPVEH